MAKAPRGDGLADKTLATQVWRPECRSQEKATGSVISGLWGRDSGWRQENPQKLRGHSLLLYSEQMRASLSQGRRQGLTPRGAFWRKHTHTHTLLLCIWPTLTEHTTDTPYLERSRLLMVLEVGKFKLKVLMLWCLVRLYFLLFSMGFMANWANEPFRIIFLWLLQFPEVHLWTQSH